MPGLVPEPSIPSVAVQQTELFTAEGTALLTLAAIAPAIVVTVLYNFIVQIDLRLQEIRTECRFDSRDDLVRPVEQFVVVSAKLFHLTLAYYLLMLIASLVTYLADDPAGTTSGAFGNDRLAVSFASVIYFLYVLGYWIRDVRPSFDANDVTRKGWNAFLALFLVAPLLIPLLHREISGPMKPFAAWLAIDIAFILAWWAVVPPVFQPLTKLARIARGSAMGHEGAPGCGREDDP